VIDEERSALKAHISQIESEEKHMQEELMTLEKQLRNKDKEYRMIQRDWERQIEQQKD